MARCLYCNKEFVAHGLQAYCDLYCYVRANPHTKRSVPGIPTKKPNGSAKPSFDTGRIHRNRRQMTQSAALRAQIRAIWLAAPLLSGQEVLARLPPDLRPSLGSVYWHLKAIRTGL